MKLLRIVIPGTIVIALVLIGALTGVLGNALAAVKDFLVRCLEAINGFDPLLAALSFLGLYVAATVLFVPGLLLTAAAGLLFGVVNGIAYVSLASVTGASLAFLIGRYLARDWVAGKLEGNKRFRAIDQAIGKEGLKIVLLLRLSPLFPFNLLNYALGLTGVGFGRYLLASWIGMLPGTVMYVYLGSLAGSVAALATGTGSGKTPSQWILFALGLLATVVVTIYITRLAQRALNSELAPASPV